MADTKNIFDIIGPVMIGPSSSHTAGACKIGFLAGKIFGQEKISKINIKLFNSFAKTGFGHGTQMALVGGILGMKSDDVDIKNSFKIAKERGIEISLSYFEDFQKHPNTAIIQILDENSKVTEITGISTGGGEIEIKEINGSAFNIKGGYDTLILIYKDTPGMVYRVANLISGQKINIAQMFCDRNAKGMTASMGIGLDSPVPDSIIEVLSKNEDIYFIRKLEKIR